MPVQIRLRIIAGRARVDGRMKVAMHDSLDRLSPACLLDLVFHTVDRDPVVFIPSPVQVIVIVIVIPCK